MTDFYERAAWTTAPLPLDRLTPLVTAQVRGIAVHHTGSPVPLGPRPTLAESTRRLEQDRLLHTGERGWADVACTAAVDAQGRVFECRGIRYRSAGNGTRTANQQYAAVTLLLGDGDEPTEAMIEAFRDWRSSRWLARYPAATAVVAHRDLYPTPCPGEATLALIASGTLTSGGTVALTDAEIDAIATRTRDKLLAVTYGSQPDGRPFTLGMLWGEVRINAIRAATGVDVETLAGAVVAKLPTGDVDVRALAAAVADELAARLAPSPAPAPARDRAPGADEGPARG